MTLTLAQLFAALSPDERELPIEAFTEWESDSVGIVSAAVVEPARYSDDAGVLPSLRGQVSRPACVLLCGKTIAAGQLELDGSAIRRVVFAGAIKLTSRPCDYENPELSELDHAALDACGMINYFRGSE